MTGEKKLLKEHKAKIARRTLRVGVIGLGYVGLPLAVGFAKAGFPVTGIDVDLSKVDRLRRGVSYVLDVHSSDVRSLVRSSRLKATSDYKALSGLDAVIICVPTPLSKTKKPDISFVMDAATRISKYLRRGQLVILESTTYPGTTEEVVLPILEQSGLKARKDFFLAFSPERIDPGNKNFDALSIPKIVGGTDRGSSEAAGLLYGSIMKRVVRVSSAKTAEMVKCLENTFRSVNIGLINEMALLCNRLGIDIWEVIEAAKTKPFGFMPFYPGPGLGGHCLPIDPLYLSWKSRVHGFEARMVELAAAINEEMPRHVVDRVTTLLNDQDIPLHNAAVLVLGVSYKRNIDDVRESPALDVIQRLLEKGAQVTYSDPFVKSLKVGCHSFRSSALTPEFLKKQACVVVVTDHSAFNYGAVAKHARLILDTRNVMRSYGPRKGLFFL